MDLINLPRILNNKVVTNHIPVYFNHKETPCISFKYTATIAKEIFNFKRTCNEFSLESGTNRFPCHCDSYSEFIHPNVGHVVTGDLRLVKNQELRKLLARGPGFRELNNIQWNRNRDLIE